MFILYKVHLIDIISNTTTRSIIMNLRQFSHLVNGHSDILKFIHFKFTVSIRSGFQHLHSTNFVWLMSHSRQRALFRMRRRYIQKPIPEEFYYKEVQVPQDFLICRNVLFILVNFSDSYTWSWSTALVFSASSVVKLWRMLENHILRL